MIRRGCTRNAPGGGSPKDFLTADLPNQFVEQPTFSFLLCRNDPLRLFSGHSALGLWLEGRPELGRQDRSRKPAHANREVVCAAQNND